jgi:phage-related protein
VPGESELVWVGTSLSDLRGFPPDARHDCGYQLEQVQFGRDPDDWKSMPAVGSGCREVRVKAKDGIYRVFYVAKLDDRVYVLHSFVKKTQKTPRRDIKLGTKRYDEAVKLAAERRRT